MTKHSATHRLILDCDPGVDDAVALLLALGSPRELQLLGITTVAGNVGPGLTARNARLIRELAAREDVPIHAGCERPLVRPPVDAGDFHGQSGLGTLPVHEPRAPLAVQHAVPFIVETLLREPAASVTLVITGPMTNVAMAMRLEPRILPRIREVVFMGGARSIGGNITASAEYNIYADPHAARVVCESGLPIVALGLDATHQVRATQARIAALRSLGSARAQAAADLMAFSSNLPPYRAPEPGAPLHDPCTIAYLLNPALFELAPVYLNVETDSALTLGHTAVEFRLEAARPTATRWATAADADGIFALLQARLA
jgi:purine nucleosidase